MDVKIGLYVVTVILGFTDNWPDQLRAVRLFLGSHGVRVGGLTGRKWNGKNSAWQLRICNVAGVLRAATMMLPHTVKKRVELQAAVDYLRDKITDNKLVEAINHEIKIGNRMGTPKSSSLPFVKSEGNRLRHEFSLNRAHEAVRIRIPQAQMIAMRQLYDTGDYSISELSRRYGYQRRIIKRVLQKPNLESR